MNKPIEGEWVYLDEFDDWYVTTKRPVGSPEVWANKPALIFDGEMKTPLQAILVAGEQMRDDIRNNKKKITIREGHRDYRINEPVILCCHILNWAVMRKIVRVDHTTLREVSELEWTADGYTSQEDMLEKLQKFYPNLTLDSCVTIVWWEEFS